MTQGSIKCFDGISKTEEKMTELEKLKDVIKELRDPEHGCPWDLKQTHKTLLKYLLEESYEYIHAVEHGDKAHMEEEIGDVLLQVLLHAQIANENGDFDLESVSKKLSEKLIRRHPHVFENRGSKIDVSDVVTNWEKIKAEEKAHEEAKGLIDQSYLHFPALFSAHKIGKKTAKIGFDWKDATEVLTVVQSEWDEMKEEITGAGSNERLQEELGDLLFSMAQLSRHLGFDPEETLRMANKKFIRRFEAMEKLIKNDRKDLHEMNQEQMDLYWDQVKKDEKA